MPPLKPTNKHDSIHHRPWLFGGVISFCVLAVVTLFAATLLAGGDTTSDPGYTQAQLLEETLGVAHDELIMLIISLVVVIQVAANFNFLKRLPGSPLIFCSFGLVVLSAFCTVAETLLFPEVLNYVEHLSFMTAAILMAVWCWWVFDSKKQEDS